MMKHKSILFIAGALAVIAGLSCNRETPIASKVILSSQEVWVAEDSTVALSATVRPAAADQKITWRTLKPGIATVDENGIVTGVAGGKTYVTATAGSVTSGCIVNVIAHVTGVHLNVTEAKVELDGVFLLKATLEPEVAFNDTLHWKSLDPSIAVVGGDHDAVVTGMKIGETDIVVTTDEGGFTDTCHVSVVCSVKSVKVTCPQSRINVGETIKCSASVLPENATDQSLVWSSSDESVATVDAYGNVTGHKRGNVTVKATSVNGVEGSVELEVYAPVTGIEINKSTLELYVGDRETLVSKILPEDANVQRVTWSSNKTTVATVGAGTGLVTAKAAGEATITVKTTEGGFSAQCVVTVIKGTASVSGIELDHSAVRLVVGGTVELFANVLPRDAAEKGVTWATDNSTVASVSSGKITAKDCGTCTVTATTRDGGFVAKCAVTVVGFDAIAGGFNENGYEWID